MRSPVRFDFARFKFGDLIFKPARASEQGPLGGGLVAGKAGRQFPGRHPVGHEAGVERDGRRGQRLEAACGPAADVRAQARDLERGERPDLADIRVGGPGERAAAPSQAGGAANESPGGGNVEQVHGSLDHGSYDLVAELFGLRVLRRAGGGHRAFGANLAKDTVNGRFDGVDSGGDRLHEAEVRPDVRVGCGPIGPGCARRRGAQRRHRDRSNDQQHRDESAAALPA